MTFHTRPIVSGPTGIVMGMPVSFPVQVQNAAKNDPEGGLLTVSPKLDYTQQIQLMKPFMDKLTENITTMAETKIGTLVAPINEGDVVGTVEYKVGDSKLFTSNLYANRSVKEGILSSEPVSTAQVGTDQQPQVSAGAQLLGAASTLTGEPVKESNTKKIILIVLIVLLALAAIAFVVFLIVARIRRERRRKARAAARRKQKMQQERIARQRAAELDRDR